MTVFDNVIVQSFDKLEFVEEFGVGSGELGVAVQIRSGFDFIGNPEDFNHNSPLHTPHSTLKQIPVYS